MRGATLRYLEGADCGYEVGRTQGPMQAAVTNPTFVLIGRTNKRGVPIGPVTVTLMPANGTRTDFQLACALNQFLHLSNAPTRVRSYIAMQGGESPRRAARRWYERASAQVGKMRLVAPGVIRCLHTHWVTHCLPPGERGGVLATRRLRLLWHGWMAGLSIHTQTPSICLPVCMPVNSTLALFIGVQVNYPAAARQYGRASDAGNGQVCIRPDHQLFDIPSPTQWQASFNLGYMLEVGAGVGQDSVRAVEMYRLSLEQTRQRRSTRYT